MSFGCGFRFGGVWGSSKSSLMRIAPPGVPHLPVSVYLFSRPLVPLPSSRFPPPVRVPACDTVHPAHRPMTPWCRRRSRPTCSGTACTATDTRTANRAIIGPYLVLYFNIIGIQEGGRGRVSPILPPHVVRMLLPILYLVFLSFCVLAGCASVPAI